MAAPTPEPVQLKLLKGRTPTTDSGGRPIKQTPGFRRIAPEPPEFLSGYALDMWHEVVPELTRLEILKPEDAAALATYCEAWADFAYATQQIAEDGYYIEARQGKLRHPAVGIKHQAMKEIRAIAAHFGLTPSTEAALARGGGDDDDGNPFD